MGFHRGDAEGAEEVGDAGVRGALLEDHPRGRERRGVISARLAPASNPVQPLFCGLRVSAVRIASAIGERSVPERAGGEVGAFEVEEEPLALEAAAVPAEGAR